MAQCASWNPVVRPGVPYEDIAKVPEGPPQEELDAMTFKQFNKARTAAKRQWYWFCRHLWRAIPSGKDSDWQEDEIIQKFYRPGRAALFGDDQEYGCHYHAKKFWDRSINFADSWAASKPDWYTFD